MKERNDSVMRSPRLEAMGVATLSGLILRQWDTITTVIMTLPSKALARHAADILEPPSSRSSWKLVCSPLTRPRKREMRVARPATTSAWPCRGRQIGTSEGEGRGGEGLRNLDEREVPPR